MNLDELIPFMAKVCALGALVVIGLGLIFLICFVVRAVYEAVTE